MHDNVWFACGNEITHRHQYAASYQSALRVIVHAAPHATRLCRRSSRQSTTDTRHTTTTQQQVEVEDRMLSISYMMMMALFSTLKGRSAPDHHIKHAPATSHNNQVNSYIKEEGEERQGDGYSINHNGHTSNINPESGLLSF